MMQVLSPNTQAILLLTAPLIAGKGGSSSELLSPGEYKILARHLREIKHQPADLLLPDAIDLLKACGSVIDESRLQRLLGRGFLLSQVVERWQARAIWVVSRADAAYPRRLKARLREDAPAVIYGCGDMALLESGGLAVVGSRHVNDTLIDYTMAVGCLAARAGRTVVSGGARGIDQAAMRGALEAGGSVSGVLADSLEKTAMNREHRNALLDGQLVLISPYDPSAGFNVGHAMQRNKLIYALSDFSLVVSSDVKKGGTWAGAIEQLDKLKFVPVYVRSAGESSAGLDALRAKGAIPWPEPQNPEAFEGLFHIDASASASCLPADFSLHSESGISVANDALSASSEQPVANGRSNESAASAVYLNEGESLGKISSIESKRSDAALNSSLKPADALFSTVREVIQSVLKTPMKDVEVAAVLDVSGAQAKAWLQRLLAEGVVEKQKKPSGYIAKRSMLFE